MMLSSLFTFLSLIFCQPLLSIVYKHEVQQADRNSIQVTVTFKLDPQEILFKDTLQFSLDTTQIRLSEWSSTIPAKPFYDPSTQETKEIWDENVAFTLFAIKESHDIIDNPHLNVFYQTNTHKAPFHEIIKLPFKNTLNTKPLKDPQSYTNAQPSASTHQEKSITTSNTASSNISAQLTCYYQKLENIIQQSSSLPIRLALAFLLGLLLSLTPCIYPMIPITVGILQSHQKKSFIQNFMRALSYTLGLSTTFAILGLIASYTGPLYGRLLSQPLFVVSLAAFLTYLALTMLGICELYVPRFAQTSYASSTKSSLISSFMIGAASGTFASPCVSPGLILLLSIVATMNSTLAGFLLLFSFGIGLSMPLLIVGTFSTSLDMLPRAGLWMIEIKKIFGVLLLGAALYYLSNVINSCVTLSILTVMLFVLGLFYAYSAQKSSSKNIKQFETICAILLMASSIVTGVQTYFAVYCSMPKTHQGILWHESYVDALAQARTSQKLLFIDVWADYCSMCKLIDKTLLHSIEVTQKLDSLVVPLKINGTNEQEENYAYVKKQYPIMGFPTFLLIDPATEQVIKKWHSDLYYIKPADFINEIEQSYCKK